MGSSYIRSRRQIRKKNMPDPKPPDIDEGLEIDEISIEKKVSED